MRGYNIDDYINRKFNKLTLIKNLNKIDKHNSKLALFKCDCGNEKEIVFTQVLSGEVQSCGCNVREFSNLKNVSTKKDRLVAIMEKEKKTNKTGHYGISKVNGKYRARICVKRKNYTFAVILIKSRMQ